ncbi:MAG: CBS domain-containing protein [Candidatus Limnocylindria bacterium]
MKTKEIMTREPVTLAPEATAAEAATLMKQEDCGSLPVVEGGVLVGIVTDRDIVVRGIAAGKDPRTLRIAEIMSADPVTISPDTDVDEAAAVMAERQVRRLPVVEDGRLVGLLVIAQVARREDEAQTGETLKEISEPRSGRGSHARG